MMDRHYPPQPSYAGGSSSAAPKVVSKKPSVMTILASAKRANPVKAGSSSSHLNGPLQGNTLNSRAPAHSSASAYILPSFGLDELPVEPSLFAYSSPTSPGRHPKQIHDSGASIHSTQTSRTSRTKSDDRAIIRNARGEIEWKHAPPTATPASSASHSGPPPRPARRSPLPPADNTESRSRSRSNGAPRRESNERRQQSQSAEASSKATGSSSNHLAAPQRPANLRRRSTDDTEGFETAEEDDVEAREWERKRELQMEADRLEVYRRQLEKQDGERKIRSKASRDRLDAEAQRERQSLERRQAEQEARRLAREEKRRQEKEERKQKEKEEAQRRRFEAERAAEEERIRKKKEAEQKEIRRKQKEEEERKRKEEEAIKKAEEEVKRKEEERLAAIKAAQDAVLEKERRLVEAKRQVEEEDVAARKAGRKQERRMKRALAAGFPPGYVDPAAPPSDDEDDEDVFHPQSDSENGSEVFVDAGAEDDAEAKSATTGGSLARSASNRDAPSSTDGSSDMPGTPSDDKPHSMLAQPSQWSNGSHGPVKFAVGTNGGPTPTVPVPQQMVPFRFDRFRHAVKVGARPAPIKPEMTAATSTSLLAATFAATDDEDSADFEEDSSEIVKPKGPYREGGITYGRGWCAHGLADPSLVIDHRRYVNVNRTNLKDGYTIHYIDQVMYSGLPELIFSATTPDVIARLISHLDYADVKTLRQISKSIRFALGQLGGREVVLSRFLGPVGYEPWKPAQLPTSPEGPAVEKDPFPLTFADCEGFLLSFDVQSEYARVGAEFARAPHKVDPRYPKLARATTRAYNRVLTRLRMQPNYRAPASSKPTSPAAGSQFDMAAAVTSPWKPGRAALFRTWVPCSGGAGWLSDVEFARCERELFIAGVYPHLKKGDIVWDTAVGDERNDGKYVFDGHYLRDLSVMFDRAGHLPSWLNSFAFAPSYYHNLIRSSDASEPVVYLDVLPWRDHIVSTMRLVQDQVETISPAGARYRISKWLYRAVITITPGTIISDEGLQVVDAGWHGKVVIETEGTAEHAKVLISRCTGPAESVQTKARLLASIMGNGGEADVGELLKSKPKTRDQKGNKVETTTPWAIVRARSRPGLIWIRPLNMRHRVVF